MADKESFKYEGPTVLKKDGKVVVYPAGSDKAPKTSKYEVESKVEPPRTQAVKKDAAQ